MNSLGRIYSYGKFLRKIRRSIKGGRIIRIKPEEAIIVVLTMSVFAIRLIIRIPAISIRK
jgi:hypothetical protein